MNAVQLAKFGEMYSERFVNRERVVLNVPVLVQVESKASQYELVLSYEKMFSSVVEV